MTTPNWRSDIGCEGAIAQLPTSLQKFMVFEQRNLWRPERWRNLTSGWQLDRRYLPESAAVFRLPCFLIQRKHLYVYGGHVDSSTEIIQPGENAPESPVLFPVHPVELPRYAEFLTKVRARDARENGVSLFATPTSSTRTVLAWLDGRPTSACFVKLSLCSPLLGDRRIRQDRAAKSVGLSRLVHRSGCDFPRGIDWFPEILGLVPRLMADGGVIFRSIPADIKEGRGSAAALFALIGGSCEYPPLLVEMLAGKRDAVRKYLEEVLLQKFAGIWVDLVFGKGLILEAHGQDLLLALSPDGVPIGTIYYRDFEGAAVDWVLRRASGLSAEEDLWHVNEWFKTYETLGYPLHQLVSWKIRTSLYGYVELVLGELEAAVEEWLVSRRVVPKLWEEGELTSLFSGHLRNAIRGRFGVREGREYDIRKDLNGFVKFLMRVRTEVMRQRGRVAIVYGTSN